MSVMEEGKIKFRPLDRGFYAVWTDCITGKMEYVGQVEKQPSGFWRYTFPAGPDGKRQSGVAYGRLQAAQRLI